ncbi:MAG: hypothetical protein IPK22_18585 [Verrucomicrobiaceae bacterium]|nr:hypothetical protein [Verrucomicrobiaceae bacterium]
MSFRRNTSKALKWQQWLRKHQDELLACGIPLAVLQDESNWLYFLDHGYFTPVTGRIPVIQLEDMSREDAVRLCSFLEQSDYYPDCSTFRWLRSHFQTPTSSRP